MEELGLSGFSLQVWELRGLECIVGDLAMKDVPGCRV